MRIIRTWGKAAAITAAIVLIAPSCSRLQPESATAGAPAGDVRISDRYARGSVEAYEVFACGIERHCFAMIYLVGGDSFPMLCRVDLGGIYPIPQSVFATGGTATHWDIMCEPEVRGSYALMALKLSREDGVLRQGGAPLFRINPAPRLLERPAP